jgi:RNA polymerase sigma-70 factor (ECF subfamily)
MAASTTIPAAGAPAGDASTAPVAAGPDTDAAFVAALESASRAHFALALRMTGREEEAREVVQEAWFRAWRHRAGVREEAALHGWLRRIVARECLRLLRRRGLQRWLSFRDDPPDAPSWLPGPEHALAEGRQLRQIRAAVDRLPPKKRLAWGLRFDEGWSVAEVAGAMEVSPDTAKTHLSRALDTVRRRLETTDAR